LLFAACAEVPDLVGKWVVVVARGTYEIATECDHPKPTPARFAALDVTIA
jgi:hypothetical protein